MTRTKYVTELEKLPAGLREMAKQVDRMLAQAMETLAQRNSEQCVTPKDWNEKEKNTPDEVQVA